MYETIEYEKLDQGEFHRGYVLIDLRTPSEYRESTIPGAINIPLFTEEEREAIGIEYVQGDVKIAKGMGLRFVGSHLEETYFQLHKLVDHHEALILFCSRGGYRSSAPVALFKALGLPIFKLDGGYKKYRQYINSELPKRIDALRLISLYGHTGSGKTQLLHELEQEGYPIIDLEGLAHHKGSLLGSIGESEQPSQKMFESVLYEELKSIGNRPAFIEGESRRIGKILLPTPMMDALNRSIKIRIDSDMTHRVQRIREEYVHDNNEELKTTLDKLSRYMKPERIQKYQDSIDQGAYDYVIEELISKYYDLNYATKHKTIDHIIDGDQSDALQKIAQIYHEITLNLVSPE